MGTRRQVGGSATACGSQVTQRFREVEGMVGTRVALLCSSTWAWDGVGLSPASGGFRVPVCGYHLQPNSGALS